MWRDHAPLGAQSWFRCGGTAERLFTPPDEAALAAFLAENTQETTILGAMANTIVRDGGVPGVTLRLGAGFCGLTQVDTSQIRVSAGTLNGTLAAAAAKAGVGGLAFLSGIPGTIGGALAMNAGAYGAEMADVVQKVYAIDAQGQSVTLMPQDIRFSYRASAPPEGLIFTGALLKGETRPSAQIWAEMETIKKKRLSTQPIRERTGGSTFANPSTEDCTNAGVPPSTKAWQVVERVGGRGLRLGGAMMSEQHANFMVNTGAATATDLEMLGEEIRRRALDALGLDLKWEIQRVGVVK